MEYKKLSDIADIQSGLVLSRKEAKPDSKSIYRYQQLSLRSVNEDGSLNIDALIEYCSWEKLSEQFTTQKNEIVMRLFSPLCPLLITETYSGLVVPSQFAIIRLKSKAILPAYLCYYLSQHNVLNEMAVMDSGQSVRGIKISTLSEIQIPLLIAEKQEVIIAVADLRKRINALHLELLRQYDIRADVAIKRIIGGQDL